MRRPRFMKSATDVEALTATGDPVAKPLSIITAMEPIGYHLMEPVDYHRNGAREVGR